MPRGGNYGTLGTSPILEIASGLARGRLEERDRADSIAARVEAVERPKRERRRAQELAREQLRTLDPTLADESLDETRDYDTELAERRALRRRATAYRMVNPAVSLEQAEALMLVGPNAAPKKKEPPRRTYDRERGVMVDEDTGTATPVKNLPARPTTPRAPSRSRIVTTDQGVFTLNEDTNTLTPVQTPTGGTAQPRPTGGRSSAATLAALLADTDTTPPRPPLTEDQKRRARNDARYRIFLQDEKGYTPADWAATPATSIPPTR